jgi:hypothetical protein
MSVEMLCSVANLSCKSNLLLLFSFVFFEREFFYLIVVRKTSFVANRILNRLEIGIIL